MNEENKNMAEEPNVPYGNNRITFSTLETQGDIQLRYAMSLTPLERLALMVKLNEFAFQNVPKVEEPSGKRRIIFTSYEYIP